MRRASQDRPGARSRRKVGSISSVRARLKNLDSLRGGRAGEPGALGEVILAPRGVLKEPGRWGEDEEAAGLAARLEGDRETWPDDER